ncbi:hypothetical protein AVEN_214194-1 [Araneus ventricosus]|uniref:Uncharacterized protein n=1 Tax=Araneus ventricosus TaxID=182803 RepID=A0A4Y2FW45_ARAVE|nr:hypothetical protein AVEN_214194-1 [Araneus ventricosus]
MQSIETLSQFKLIKSNYESTMETKEGPNFWTQCQKIREDSKTEEYDKYQRLIQWSSTWSLPPTSTTFGSSRPLLFSVTSQQEVTLRSFRVKSAGAR